MKILQQTQRQQQQDKATQWKQVHRVIDTLWINENSFLHYWKLLVYSARHGNERHFQLHSSVNIPINNCKYLQ